jgi:drug/metabolite transporter (DMT)-like permease
MSNWIYAILTVLFTAAFTLLLRGAMHVWPVGLAGLLSRCVTLPLLGVWILGRGAGWRRLRTQGMLGPILLMGAISVVINLLWFAALKFTAATNVSMLMSLDLVFVVVLGALLGLERISLREVALLPVLLLGMALLVGAANGAWGGHLTGDLMAVGVALAYAVNAFVIRAILRHMDEEALALYNHGLSTLGFAGLALLGGDLRVAGPALSSPAAWAWIVGVGVIAAVSLPLYYAALHRLSVWRLRAWLLLAPVLVAVVEWLLGVRLSLTQWLGAVTVLGALAVLIRMEWQAAAGRAPRQSVTLAE